MSALGWIAFGAVAVATMALVGTAGAVVLIWAADRAEALIARVQG